MSQIMKSYLGIFMIVFLMVSAIGILSAFLTVMDAQDMHARVINEIEDSDYSPKVIRDNLVMVRDRGYELNVTLFYAGGGKKECRDMDEVPENTGSVLQARVDISFPFQVQFFGIKKMHTLSGYAR